MGRKIVYLNNYSNILLFFFFIVNVLIVVVSSQQITYEQNSMIEDKLIEWTSQELIENVEEWKGDFSVMFHTQFCIYCKQTFPVWKEIANYYADGKGFNGLKIVTFDCEKDPAVCKYLGVDRYPTIMFFGYSTFYRNDPITTFFFGRKSILERSVIFEGERYFEMIRDWISVMNTISFTQKLSNKVLKGTRSFFGFNKRKPYKSEASTKGLAKEQNIPQADITSLIKQIEKLSEENDRLKETLYMSTEEKNVEDNIKSNGEKNEGEKEDEILFSPIVVDSEGIASMKNLFKELFGEAPKDADAFALLAENYENDIINGSNTIDIGSTSSHIIECISDLSENYCTYSFEPYCEILPACKKENFQSQDCRPKECPFRNDGCLILSYCTIPQVLSQFDEHF